MSQAAAILDYLRSGRELTPLEALDKFACFRLAARIEGLRAAGHAIDTRIETRNGKRYAAYRLAQPVQLDMLG